MSEFMSNPVVVLSTVGKPDDAERIAQTLVERRLAACVNVVPGVLSLFRWEGRVHRDVERLLLIKTTRERFEEMYRALIEMHPYELPEVLVLPVVGGHPPYLEWVADSTGTPLVPEPFKPEES
jgi:periplasmic divalent cation tolerance protein